MVRLDKDVDSKYVMVFRKGIDEIVIYFDCRLIRISEGDFVNIGTEIFDASGGKIVMIVTLAEYGIITLRENLAIDIEPVQYPLEMAAETVVKKIRNVLSTISAT